MTTDAPKSPTLTPQEAETLALSYRLGLANALVALEAQYTATQIHEFKPVIDHLRSEIQEYRAGFDRLTKGMVPS